MPFPRVVEILDAIAQYFQRHDKRGIHKKDGEGEEEDLHRDIQNFRLVCKDFADAGIRYLAPVVTLMRFPEAFEVANEIANHPVARLYVRRLVFFHEHVAIKKTVGKHPNTLAMMAYQVNQFQISGEDMRSLERLIRAFSQLKQVEFELLNDRRRDEEWLHHKTKKINEKLGFDCVLLLTRFTRTPLDFLRLLEDTNVDTLVLVRIALTHCIRSSPACFRHLRTLKVVSHSLMLPTATLSILDWAPVLEELQYSGAQSPTLDHRGEVLAALPQTLKVLRLEYIELIGEFLPPNLRILDLCHVLFGVDTLPASLSDIRLMDVHLFDKPISVWADVLSSLKSGCTFSIIGHFKVEGRNQPSHWLDESDNQDDDMIGFLECADFALDTRVGAILGHALRSRSASDGSNHWREKLLRLLFSEQNGLLRHESRHQYLEDEDPLGRLYESTTLKAQYDQLLAYNLIFPMPPVEINTPPSHFWYRADRAYTFCGIVG